MPRSGGEKALTKPVTIHDEAFKDPLTIGDIKVGVIPKMIDDSIVINGSKMDRKPKARMKVATIKPKAAVRRTSRLYKATQCLYNLEEANAPEQSLNIDLNLYQMEDY